MPTADAQRPARHSERILQNLIGTNDTDNEISSSAVVANADGSVLERLEYVQTQAAGVASLSAAQATLQPNLATKAFAAAGTSLTTVLSPVSAFTVTGHVMLRIFGVTGATPLASTGTNGTLAVGISGSTTIYLGTTTADGTNFTAGAVWIDTSPTLKSEAFVAANLVWHLVSSVTVIVTVATNSMTAGILTLYCEWRPLSSGATVVAA